MNKPGPKRKEGRRYPSGDLHPEMPAMALQRRRELLGITDASFKPMKAEHGRALDTLHFRGYISYAEKEAGNTLRGAWLRYKAVSGIPSRNIRQPGKAAHHDPEWKELDDAQGRYQNMLYTACAGTKATKLAHDLLDAICLADDLILCPYILDRSNHGERLRSVVKDALGALARHLGIAEKTSVAETVKA